MPVLIPLGRNGDGIEPNKSYFLVGSPNFKSRRVICESRAGFDRIRKVLSPGEMFNNSINVSDGPKSIEGLSVQISAAGGGTDIQN